jgi:hypothetical protein
MAALYTTIEAPRLSLGAGFPMRKLRHQLTQFGPIELENSSIGRHLRMDQPLL